MMLKKIWCAHSYQFVRATSARNVDTVKTLEKFLNLQVVKFPLYDDEQLSLQG